MSLILFLFSLSDNCPKGMVATGDLCRYENAYFDSTPVSGPQKPFDMKQAFLSPRLIDLGRYLFFDPILSGDGTVSCASCHQPERSFTDGKGRAVGVGEQLGTRSAPTLWNVAFADTFFWDARSPSLEDQALGPLYSPREMGATRAGLEKALNANAQYRRLFQDAFGDRRPRWITVQRVARALAEFERSLVSFRSRYDEYVFGKESALSDSETRGLQIFRSFVTRCTECHTPPLFTNFQTAIIGAPDAHGLPADPGMGETLRSPKLRGAFKIPTLRNIARTAPYMHSGAFGSLEEVVDFYNQGGGRRKPGYDSPYLHWHIREMGLSAAEKRDLVAFLGSLTDESALPERPARLPSEIGKSP